MTARSLSGISLVDEALLKYGPALPYKLYCGFIVPVSY